MKKILAVLALLALVLGTLSAQDGELTIKGMLATGVRVQAADEYHHDQAGADHEKAYIDAYNDDEGHSLRAQVQADYKTENSGVSIRLRVDADKPTDTTLQLINRGHAYGWFKFLPGGIAELSGGLLNNAKWGTYTDFYFDGSLDNRNFTKLDIRPIEGLSFGVNLINPQIGRTPAMGHVFSGTVIGAEYKVPDMFGIRLAAMIGEKDAYSVRDPNALAKPLFSQRQGPLSGNAVFWHATDGEILDSKWNSDFGMMWSAFFTGVENLRVDFEGGLAVGKYTPQGGTDEETWSSVGLAVMGNYSITEPLWAGLRAVFETAPAKEKNVAFLSVQPQAGYVVNDWLALELRIPIALLGGYKDGGLSDADFSVGVKPILTFTLNENTKVVAFYHLDATTYGKYSTQSPPKAEKTGIHNTVQLDLIWKF